MYGWLQVQSAMMVKDTNAANGQPDTQALMKKDLDFNEAVIRSRSLDLLAKEDKSMDLMQPKVSEATNLLWSVIKKKDPGTMPAAITELLRILDLYADKDIKTFKDKISNSVQQILPLAVQSIRGAA
jgi:hypothetical protein